MVINVATNLNKLQLEKNNFIRELSREQFDGVMVSKYKKLFIEYFNGNISDGELSEKINKNLELIDVYEDGDNGKIDSNQYLYSAIVDVALNYYNVANGFETCINKMNLFASYFQLCATLESRMEHLHDLIYDVFFINANLDGADAESLLNMKLAKVKDHVARLDEILDEIAKHESVISDVEKQTKTSFYDELHVDETIKEMFVMFQDSANTIKNDFKALVEDCIDENTGAKLNILDGTLTGGASK